MSGWEKFLYLPGWLLIVLTTVSSFGLVGVFVSRANDMLIAYVFYGISFYTLCVDCIYLYRTLPRWIRYFKERFYANPYVNRYMTDIDYKVRISLYLSLGINLAYSGFKFISGIVYGAFWFDAFAVYYLLLTITRFLLLRYMRKHHNKQDLIGEFQRYRLCGILMLILNVALSGVVAHMMIQNKAYAYNEIVIITMATYAFYAVTVSVTDLIRYRKYERPVVSAAKATRFTAALVSLLSVEASMLSKYGNDETFRRLMISLTGAGVCLLVLGMSVYMILSANRAIKKLRSYKHGRKYL